eukprot:TRINITY_DN1664_c1_g1_i3.p1 TRINITY_DN1664_c1_g1~~TRINITY_DN1664_c1_g1_i3.p1  ORF type:complete len:158 (-),score=57.85 TRINITY_DN1664_c1_g1_i3:88-561(-)
MIIYPVLVDQPFWAARMASLGTGPSKFVRLRDFKEEVLMEQLNQVLTPEVKQRTEEISNLLKQENGVATAVAVFNERFKFEKNCGIQCNWIEDELQPKCLNCQVEFSFFIRRHHCRSCGSIFCSNCISLFKIPNYPTEQFVCINCKNQRQSILSKRD